MTYKINRIFSSFLFAGLVALVGSFTSAYASEVTGTLTTGLSTGVEGTVIVAPTANPPAGTYTGTQNVVLTATGAPSIRYTTNGSEPSCSDETSVVYTSPVVVASSLTIKARSCYSGETSSSVVSFPYVINAETTSGGGGGGGGGSSISGSVSGGGGPVLSNPPATAASTPTPSGSVLGASTSCGISLSAPLGYRRRNDPVQVKKLQQFLNDNLGIHLPITGFFGPQTRDAVMKFQLKYADDVLAPWVPHGLPNKMTPTGFVYKTTLRFINNILCHELNLPLPSLP